MTIIRSNFIPLEPSRPCLVVGCIGHDWCSYCGNRVDDPDSRLVQAAAGCLRRGDVRGALHLLNSSGAALCPPSAAPAPQETP